MTRIESKEVILACTLQECFDFLSDLNNYKLLLPESKISDWKSTKESCSFKIQSAYHLELIYDGAEGQNKIKIKSGPASPIKFNLDLNLEMSSDLKVYLICDADINPFLKMMVEKPLKNLFDYMADRLLQLKG